MSIWIRVGGVPATEIAAHTPPTWETLADGGCGAASFAFNLSVRAQHQALVAGSLVEIMAGPVSLYRGLLTEPDRTTWEVQAFGLSSSLRDRLALDGDGNSTRNLATAISRAVTLGWRGTNPTPVSGTAAGDTSGNPVKLGELLDNYAEQTGQRWGVDGFGRLYMRPDPTKPHWITSPGSVVFGVTDESSPTLLAGRYDDGTGTLKTAYAGTSGTEESVDLTDRVLTLTAAEAILAGMLVRGGERKWTNGVTLTREQLTTAGGNPAGLMSVTAGAMMRAHSFGYAGMSTLWLDTVIGKTRYTAGEDVIYLEPVNIAPRSLSDVIAAA